MLHSRPRGRGFEPHCRHCVVVIYPSLALIPPRKTRPCLTEILCIGRKKSNQTNKQNMAIFHFSRIPKYRYVKGSQIKASNIVSHLLKVLRYIRLHVFIAMIRVLMKSHVSKEYDEISETSCVRQNLTVQCA